MQVDEKSNQTEFWLRRSPSDDVRCSAVRRRWGCVHRGSPTEARQLHMTLACVGTKKTTPTEQIKILLGAPLLLEKLPNNLCSPLELRGSSFLLPEYSLHRIGYFKTFYLLYTNFDRVTNRGWTLSRKLFHLKMTTAIVSMQYAMIYSNKLTTS